jgi:hypothetical protein
MARYCQRYGRTPADQGPVDYELVMVSSDKDLIQLAGLWQNVFLWRGSTQRAGTQHGWAVRPDYPPEKYLALVGDDGDNIPGVTGEKTAQKLLADIEALEDFLNKPYKPKVADTRALAAQWISRLPETNREVFTRNLILVSLLGTNCLVPMCPITALQQEPPDLTKSISTLLGYAWTPPEEAASEAVA